MYMDLDSGEGTSTAAQGLDGERRGESESEWRREKEKVRVNGGIKMLGCD